MEKSIQKCLIMLMSAVIAFTCLFAFEAALPQCALTAYAASISAPSVKAENTSPTSVKLKWKKVKGAKKYVVYRSTKKNKGFKAAKTIKKSSTVSYTDKKLKAGSTYYYKVAAVNGKSKKSSKAVKIKAIPSVVKGIDGESKTCSTVTVVFNKQSGVSGYDIQYSATENGKYKTVSLQKGTSFNHTIGEGAIGFYRVRAYITVKGKKIYGGFSDIIGIEAYSHSYNQSVVEPTCIAGGYTLYTCSVCSSSYTTNPTPVTSHKFGSYIIDKDATCATTGSKHKTCSVCGFEQHKSIEATGEHGYNEYVVTANPTCTESGIETSSCRFCGKERTRIVQPTGHSYGGYVVTTPATCIEEGVESAKCNACGDTITRSTARVDHSYGEYVVTTPATCTSNGIETAHCAACEKTITREIPAIEHSYTMTNYAASCTEQGYDEYTCSDCGNSYRCNYTNALGHSYGEYVVTTPAACTTDGIESAKCVNCDATISRGIPAIGHSYGEYSVTTPASCTTDGVETACCTTCEKTITRDIPAIGHSYGEFVVTTPAACTTDGVETATCASCGATKTRPIAAIGHSYGEYVVTTPATCTTDGTQTASCRRCAITITKAIDKTGHSYGEFVVVTPSTCTTDGVEEACCSNCDSTITRDIPATGHSYGEYSVTTPATCTSNGIKVASCTKCATELKQEISATGHSYGEYVVTTPATCTSNGIETAHCADCEKTITREIRAIEHGYTMTNYAASCTEQGYDEYTCSDCGNSYRCNYTDALGHSYGEYAVTTPATDTENGVETATCASCGATKTRPIAAIGHSYGEYVVTTPATCTSNGIETAHCADCEKTITREIPAIEHSYTMTNYAASCTEQGYDEYTCSDCGNSYRCNYTNALGHSYGDYAVITPASCAADGIESAKCVNCDATISRDIPAIGHSYGEYAVTTPASCTTDGVETACCTTCEKTITRDIPAIGHSYGEFVVTTPAACTTDGVETATCASCGATKTRPIAAIGHSYGEYVVTTPATCTSNGIETAHCADCEKTITREIPAIEHSYTMTNYAASCTEQGYDEYTCSDCGNSYRCNYTNALGHSYGEYAVITPASCAADGIESAKCVNCDATISRDIPAIGHRYGEYAVTTPASCTTGGVETAYCTTCEKTITRDIPATGHSYGEYVVTTPAACTTDGVESAVCASCGATITRPIAAIGHNPQNVKNEMGYIENKCINCNELYSIDTTCYIDLTSRTISVPSVASFTVSLSGNDKLDLNYDGVSNYEITGTAENLSIDVNATADCEVKLAGVTITNTDLDIINIKDKSPNEADEAAAAGSVALDVIPVVAISAKVDTVNTLTTKAGELVKGGKIIDSDCRLELKGRGTINMDTTATAVSSMDPTDPNYPASTAIRNSEKIYIKNLTLDIKSANRGIDTKKDFKDAQGNVYDTEFYNIELSGNAKITITSTDDGIRCKNFDSNYLTADEVDSTVTINAGGDGIQLEGKSTNRLASMILHSGKFNINGTKSIINNKSMKVPVADGTATANFATIPPSMA